MSNKEKQPCESCLTCPPDDPTKIAHLGWRFFITLFAWFILGLGISPGGNFFVSLILFSIPLLVDYLKFKPKEGWRKKLRRIGIILSGFWFFIGMIGLGSIVYIKNDNGLILLKVSRDFITLRGKFLPVEYIWYGIGFSVALDLY